MKTKTRLYIIAGVFLLMFGFTAVYTFVNGSTCRIEMIHTSIFDLTPDKVRVEVDDPSIADYTKIEIIDNTADALDNSLKTAAITFKALKNGDTKAVVSYRIYDEINKTYVWSNMTPELHLHVTWLGTLVETSNLTFNGWRLVQFGILISLFIVAVLALLFFIECYFKSNFSYSMVACGGISAYCAFMLLFAVYDMQYFNTFRNFLHSISDSGYMFSILTSPFMVAFCVIIAISNIWLLRNEGFRPQNMLGIGLAVFWILGLALLFNVFTINTYINLLDPDFVQDVIYSLGYVFSFLECMLLSTAVCAFLSSKYKARLDKDYLIILGCCIRSDGSLTPILKGRVDAAVAFEKKQFSETGRHAKFVPSGGQGDDEVISESEAMKRYLIGQGYPEEQIIKEDKSVNTDQNIKFSRGKIMEDTDKPDEVKAGFATTNYHVFRGYILSKKHKLDAQGISSKTKWYFFPNAFLREFAGLLVDRKYRIGLIVLMLIAAYTIGAHLLNLK